MDFRIELNDDEEIVKLVRDGLDKKGGYCPCHIGENPDYKCICKEFREMPTEGICHCGLYKKVKV